ncbi:MFS transporter [Streptomyces sp. NPDC003832]
MSDDDRLGQRLGGTLGPRFGRLWAAYATSALGTWLAFGAFPLIAVQVLNAGPAEVAALASVGAAVGAAVAVPLGPWVEFRRKRRVLITTDLIRAAALLTIPAAYALGALTFVQLLLVSITMAASDITFRAASGAYLKSLLPPEDLLKANTRLESATWTTTLLGPPLGGAAMVLLGPVATVTTDALSHILSAMFLRSPDNRKPPPNPTRPEPPRLAALLDGWHHILQNAPLRALLLNTALFNGLVMATQPLLAVLMLGQLGFTPWQYGLAFAVPALGGLLGARLANPLATRFGRDETLVAAGTLRTIWPLGLAFITPGPAGLTLTIAVELALITSCALFNPLCATYRLEHTHPDRTTRTLTAWAVTTKATTALLTAAWGILATLLTPRTAIALAGLLLLTTPLLLPRPRPQKVRRRPS